MSVVHTHTLTHSHSHSRSQGGGVEAELCVGKCAALVADWVNSDIRNGSREPFKIFVLKSILKKAVNEVSVSQTE